MYKHAGLIVLPIACLISCGRSDLDYLNASNKLQEAAFRRDQALQAAALDAHNHAAIAMIQEITEVIKDHTRELDARIKSGQSAKMTPKERYESELNYYNRINDIARAYGFSAYAPDFTPDK